MLVSRRRRILGLALPIIGGMASQNVQNIVDTIMVGSLGDSALAAVGMASFVNMMFSAAVMGLGAAVQALAARRIGESRPEDAALGLNAGLLIALLVGVPLSALLFVIAPQVFSLLSPDPAVVELGAPYLRARLVATVAIGMNYSFRGYWNGVGRSSVYFRTLVLMHLSNIALNYVLIFGKLGVPALGVTGAGIGTATATYIGTFGYAAQGYVLARKNGFLRAFPGKAALGTLLRLGLPNSLEQFAFLGAMTGFFAILGRVGTRELAASNVIINLSLVAILPGLGFGLAAATLVGQALGASDVPAARRWGSDVARLGALSMAVVALPGLIAPRLLLGAFLHDPQTLELAVWPLRQMAILLPLETLGMVFMHGLMGAGDTRTVMLISVTTLWFVLIPSALVVGVVLKLGVLAVWLAHGTHRVILTGVIISVWRRGAWAKIKV